MEKEEECIGFYMGEGGGKSGVVWDDFPQGVDFTCVFLSSLITVSVSSGVKPLKSLNRS